jgi:prophage antirepressor-like protein
MNALSPFYYGAKEIRTVKIGDEIWFAGKDICEGLDIAWTSRTLDPIKSDWKRVMNLITPRGKQDLAVISEAAVYKLAFRSRKPEAEKFTDWIAGEVLPQIRKTGKYIPPNHGILPLVLHTDVSVQKAMSKYVNSHNFRKIGKKGAIRYNIKNCQAHNDGMTPKHLDGFRFGRRSRRVAVGVCGGRGGRAGFAFDHDFNGVDVFAGSFALFVIWAVASFGDGINAIK